MTHTPASESGVVYEFPQWVEFETLAETLAGDEVAPKAVRRTTMGLPIPPSLLARADEVRLGDICSRLCPNARATKTYDRFLTATRLAAADREGKKATKLPLSLNHAPANW
jgi:hypothetical protein